ncbi:hypothetical protein NQ315_000458 [Exocentrus adspersus]|uniref:Uncharacterized protein n=1 Tax=Exocentrus adspersus TaxID=1586481 RepID=A0AAV8VF67_9CUCU|nr:hypothetical protein NQ315_000458 [Exocentrus adspersus]
MREMRLSDCEMFFHYTRLTVEQFDDLLRTVGPHIMKKSNRAPLSADQRLAITYFTVSCHRMFTSNLSLSIQDWQSYSMKCCS